MRTSRLLALNPSEGKAQELRLGRKEITVGCDQGNDLTVVGGGVSRRHAVIRYRRSCYELRELNSTNGTFVNNQRVVASTLLSDGDEIRFGAARFMFLDQKEIKTSPIAHRPSRQRFGLRTAIGLLLFLFLIGFAAAQYLITHHYLNWPRERISPGDSRSTAPFANPVAQSTGAAGHEAVALGERPAATSAAQPDWLARVNYYRAMARLPPVVEDPTLSSGDFKHARYLVENYSSLIHSGGQLGAAMHNEEQTNSWYSAEGIAAARNSDVFEGCGSSSPARHVDGWVTGPFHRLSILNPDLSAVGYGRYENGGCWSAALDLRLQRPPLKGEERVTMFPPDEATISMPEFDGREWPNPLASCPEYKPPVGLPITLQIGERGPISLDTHAISTMGKTVEHCGFDFATYRSTNRSEQQLASQILQEYGAIVLIPREPLTSGATYKVSITAGGKYYNWSFTVGN